ncbi:uncharacterized protein PV09_02984 [Verruconis gallopava]|uniref:Cytochrome P450 oxidoreductase n=1 Tax=Verruconis gallopava TaxID=253628 RepID=A0A0D2B5R4_9PEZI|nr:uncharacterized protein PV09_02984 [Verruconis gallopava]KIW06554.1 hypothetical protein PV09_02984 [Verruconis gallopava]
MHVSILIYALGGLAIVRFVLLAVRSITSPLRRVPGPFAARFTRLWYFNRVNKGAFEKENIALHRKYGSIVRIAPDHYSIDEPAAIKQIYGIGTHFRKSDWYYGWQHPDPERHTVFSDRDIQRHAKQRRKFNALFSTSSLVNYEPFVDRCADIFIQRLTEFAYSGASFDMGHWFQCYAFDVIACITYGDRFGFLDEGKDIDQAIAHLWKTIRYSSLVGVFSEWHAFLFPYTSKIPSSGSAGRKYIMDFVQKQLDRRMAERKRRDLETGRAASKQQTEAGVPEDFLEKMLNAQEADPDRITMADVFAMGQSNIIAGSDTTAISLCAILYNLIRHPRVMQKLRAELREKESTGQCSNPRVTFKESLGMPYFQAVMKEALRMHPATGLPLWRVVPEGGITIRNLFFPAGTVVGVNTWVAHYNTDIFGSDANVFRPERWLEASPEQLRRMDAYYMPFGLGSRTCMGRHVSELEMSKLIPRLVREFDFEVTKKSGNWSSENYWFVKPTDFEVRVRLAQQES